MRASQRAIAAGWDGAVGPLPRSGSPEVGWTRRRLGVVLVATAFAAGCGDSKAPDVSRLNPRGVPFLEGVPVPQRFELMVDKVVDHESGGQRMASHEYRGSADPHAVRNFYREQMPLMGWDRVSDQNLKGVITIRFEKKHEVCTVVIESAGKLGSKTSVKIFVVPFNRTPMEPPKQPVP